MDFIFNINPCPAPRMVYSDKWNNRPVVTKYFGFRHHLRCLANIKGLQSLPGIIDGITFNISMPESWSKKKKTEMIGQPHMQTPDLDNYCKAFFDALCFDDSHIHTISKLSKIWAEQGSIKLEITNQ